MKKIFYFAKFSLPIARENLPFIFFIVFLLGAWSSMARAQELSVLASGSPSPHDLKAWASPLEQMPPLIPDPVISIRIDPVNNPTSSPLVQGDTSNFRICLLTRVRFSAFIPGVDMDTIRFRWINENEFFVSVVSLDSVYEDDLFSGTFRLEVAGLNTNFEDASTVVEICADNEAPLNARIESVSGATSICTAGPPIQLQALANADFFGPCEGEQFTYSWSKDGSPLGLSTSVINIGPGAADQGLYEVIITNTCGSSTASMMINSSSSPPSNVQIISPASSTTICNGDSLLLLAQANDQDVFRWTREGDPLFFEQGDSIYVSQAGNYILEAVNGCGSDRDTLDIVLTGIPQSLSVDVNLFSPCSPQDTVILGANGTSFDNMGLFTAVYDSIVWRRDGIPIKVITFPPTPSLGKLEVLSSGSYDFVYYNACGELTSPSQNILFTQSPDSIRILADTIGLCNPSIPEVSLRFAANAPADSIFWERSTDNVSFSVFGDSMNIQRVNSPGFYRVRLANRCGAFVSDTVEIQESFDIAVSLSEIFADTNVSCTGSLAIHTQNLGPGVIYNWVRTGTTDTVQTVDSTLILNQSGTYQVFGFNACDRTNISAPQSFIVGTQANNLRISPNTDQEVCAIEGTLADTLLALADNVSNNSIYRWFRDGTEISNDTLLRISQSGQYYFSIENECSILFSDSIQVSFITPPEAGAVILTADPCQDPTTAILNVQTIADNPTFSWFRDAETSPFAVTSVPQLTVNQSATYRVIVGNSCNPSGVSSAAVPVDVGPTLPAPIISSSPTANINQICPGEVLQLRVDDMNGLSNLRYRWFRGSSPLVNDTSASIEIRENGAYRAEVFLAGANSCSVLSEPYLVFARTAPVLLVSASGPLAFCEGDSVELIANSLVLPSRWEWYQDGNLISTEQSIFAASSGTYRVDAFYEDTIVSFPCQTTLSNTIEIRTETVPEPDFIISSGLLQALDTAQFYQWSLNGVPILNANQAQYLPLDSGQYTLTVSNGIGCSGTSAPQFHPGTFLDVTEAIRIFPNPSNGQFKVVFVSEDIAQAFLSDTQGRIIYNLTDLIKVNSISGFGEVEVEGLEPGMYFLQVISDGEILSKKILIL